MSKKLSVLSLLVALTLVLAACGSPALAPTERPAATETPARD